MSPGLARSFATPSGLLYLSLGGVVGEFRDLAPALEALDHDVRVQLVVPLDGGRAPVVVRRPVAVRPGLVAAHVLAAHPLDHLDLLDVGDVVDAAVGAAVLEEVAAAVEVDDVLPGVEVVGGEVGALVGGFDLHVLDVRTGVVLLVAAREGVFVLLVDRGERGVPEAAVQLHAVRAGVGRPGAAVLARGEDVGVGGGGGRGAGGVRAGDTGSEECGRGGGGDHRGEGGFSAEGTHLTVQSEQEGSGVCRVPLGRAGRIR
ncbi:hypothetical protein M2436_007292 [Streptomyces sp. HB372]|nr:hypothetical protein [Streptomyces sp. HB372]